LSLRSRKNLDAVALAGTGGLVARLAADVTARITALSTDKGALFVTCRRT
jgi:hypothetical protein